MNDNRSPLEEPSAEEVDHVALTMFIAAYYAGRDDDGKEHWRVMRKHHPIKDYCCNMAKLTIAAIDALRQQKKGQSDEVDARGSPCTLDDLLGP